MQLVDTHCHLDMPVFDADRAEVLQRCRLAGVQQLVIPATHRKRWDALASFCASRDGLYPALGLHPVFMADHTRDDVQALPDALRQHTPVAVGEIGLDFYIPDADREAQTALFCAQLEIARDADLPVILHVRKAHDAVLQCLQQIPVKGGIAHAFNGSMQQAERYQGLGFCLGFGGMLTYERSSKLRALARDLPLQSLVLETDAPDMTVASHHGERNSPEYLPECLQALAGVRAESIEELAQQTTLNARTVLGLSTNILAEQTRDMK